MQLVQKRRGKITLLGICAGTRKKEIDCYILERLTPALYRSRKQHGNSIAERDAAGTFETLGCRQERHTVKDSFSFSFRENGKQTKTILLFSRLTTEKLSTEPRRARSRKRRTDANECIVGTRQVSRCIAAVEPASRAWLFVQKGGARFAG